MFSIKLVLVIWWGGVVTLVGLGGRRGAFFVAHRHPGSNEGNAGSLNSQRSGFVVIIGYTLAWFTIQECGVVRNAFPAIAQMRPRQI